MCTWCTIYLATILNATGHCPKGTIKSGTNITATHRTVSTITIPTRGYRIRGHCIEQCYCEWLRCKVHIHMMRACVKHDTSILITRVYWKHTCITHGHVSWSCKHVSVACMCAAYTRSHVYMHMCVRVYRAPEIWKYQAYCPLLIYTLVYDKCFYCLLLFQTDTRAAKTWVSYINIFRVWSTTITQPDVTRQSYRQSDCCCCIYDRYLLLYMHCLLRLQLFFNDGLSCTYRLYVAHVAREHAEFMYIYVCVHTYVYS